MDADELVQRGTRVFVRRPSRADESELLALREASWSFLAPWEPKPPEGLSPTGREWFESFLAGSHSERSERLLVCGVDDGAILGVCNLNEISRGVLQSACLGYWVGEPHARRGVMTEALGLVLRHAFRTLRLHRIEANVRPENTASLALVARLGFQREGFSPRYLKIAGRWRDHERWAILVEDWRARRDR